MKILNKEEAENHRHETDLFGPRRLDPGASGGG